MGKPSRGIGPVPEGLGENLTDFLTQLRRQTLDVLAGRLSIGGSGGSGGGSGGGNTVIIGGGSGDTEADLTPPPTPTGVNVGAGIDFVGITTDPPTFSMGHGYLKTVVYGKKYSGTGDLPTFSPDSKQFEFTGEVGAFPCDPATQWHIWVKWQTKDGVLSVSPAGGTNGFQVTTGQDVTKLLAILTGQITESQLFADLGARINLVDGGAGLAGSVNQRLASVAATSGNLLANSSFETQAVVSQPRPAGFGQYNNAGINTTYLRPAGRTGGFAYGLRANATGATTFGLYNGSTDSVGGQSITGRLPGGWVATKTYVVSFWARKVNGAGWTGMNLAWNLAPSLTVSLLNPNLTASYQRYAFRITWGASVEPDAGALYLTVTAVSGTAINDEIHIDDLQVELGDTLTSYAPRTADSYAAIEIEATTRSGETSALFAQYTVKLDVGGYVSGFGLASSSTSSTFAIRADRFYVAAPSGVSGVADIVPFAVQATPSLSAAGELLPAGVYMPAAYIRDLDVALGRFQNAFITNAMIVSLSASRITAGVISVGAYIQSSTYVPGTSGWRIHGDGTAEFGAAAIRGQLVASQIDTRGLSIKDSNGNVILSAGIPLGNDSATSLGFNPTFSNWTGTYPAGWGGWSGSAPVRETGIVLGSPFAVRWTVASDTGMSATVYFPSPLPAGTHLAGSFSMNMVANAGGGKPGYLVRLFTSSDLTAFVDNTPTITDQTVSGWQKMAFTATANGAPIYGIQIYQMAAWSGMPGGLLADGSVVLFGPFSFELKTKVDSSVIDPASGWLNSNQQWADVQDGAGTRPQNNATVGAQLGTNLKDSGGTVLGDSAVKNASISITMGDDGSISVSGGPSSSGSVTAPGIGAVKTDASNAPSSILNSSISFTVNSNGTLSITGGPSVTGAVSLTGLGAGALAAINQITAANASTYIAAAAIDLANIKVASITTLGALSSYLGTVEIATGGYLRSGQTAWSTGNGFWLGWIGSGPGEPGFSIGDSGSYLRYRPSTGLEIRLDTITASISGGNISHTTASTGYFNIGSRTVSASGGTGTYTYAWTLLAVGGSVGTITFLSSSNPSNATVGFTSYLPSNGSDAVAFARCVVTDGNGRTAAVQITVASTNTS